MRRSLAILAALACAALGGCAYKGGKVVDGTNVEIGIAIPGTEWTINALSYTGGMRVCGNNATVIAVTNRVTETNSYFGVVKTSRDTELSATITPVETEAEEGSRP